MKTPASEFQRHLDDMHELIVKLCIEVDGAELASKNSWAVNQAACYAAMCRAQVIARQLVECAIDAQIEAKMEN